MKFEEYKTEVLRILKEKKVPDSFIESIDIDSEVQFAMNNNISPEDCVWALMF